MSCGVDVWVCTQEDDSSDKCSALPKVQAFSDTNEIRVFDKEDFLLKIFKFEKAFNQYSQDDVLDLLFKSVSVDVLMGINRILFFCQHFENDAPHSIDMTILSSVLLKSLCMAVNSKKRASLHVSLRKVSHEGMFHLMQDSNSFTKDLTTFEIANHSTEGKEFIITDSHEIDEILKLISQNNQTDNFMDCHHTVLSSMVIVKNRNSGGFECLKIGCIHLMDLGSCVHLLSDISDNLCNKRESFNSTTTEMFQAQYNRNKCLNNSYEDFTGNAKLSIIFSLTSVLSDMEQALCMLETVSQVQNIKCSPVINEKVILQESLKKYAEEIKALEQNLDVLKNNTGIKINQQKYRSLGNKLTLTEEQLKDVCMETISLSETVNNKKEILSRLQQQIKLTDIKIQEEEQKAKCLKVTVEETERNRSTLSMKTLQNIDVCISMKNLINSNFTYVQNQKSRVLKLKNLCNKSTLNSQLLKEDITNFINSEIVEQAKLKDSIDALLLHLKEILLDSSAQQNNFLLKANEFRENCDTKLSFWKHQSAKLASDFHNFLKESTENCASLNDKLSQELKSLNLTQDKIVDVLVKNRDEASNMIACYKNKIETSVENSVKLLFEILGLLEIIQTKMKEQLKALEYTISHCSAERMQTLSMIQITMKSVHQYFSEHMEFSSQLESNGINYYKELRIHINQEFMKVKEALDSIRNLFNLQQKFSLDEWTERESYLLKTKHLCDGSSQILKQFSCEGPNFLEKLREQYILSIGGLQSILNDQTRTIDDLCNQLFCTFNEIDNNIKNCCEENRKRNNQQESDIKNALMIQDEKVKNCMKTAHSLLEGIIQFINGGLQETRNCASSITDFRTNEYVNQIVSLLKNILKEYILKYQSVMVESQKVFLPLPEVTRAKVENSEDVVEFNHEELLSSTPSSYYQRTKRSLIDEKQKLLTRLKKMVAVQMSHDNLNYSSIDADWKVNSSVMSLPNVGLGIKVEIKGSKSFEHRKKTL